MKLFLAIFYPRFQYHLWIILTLTHSHGNKKNAVRKYIRIALLGCVWTSILIPTGRVLQGMPCLGTRRTQNMRQVQDRGYVNESRIHFPSSAAGLNFTTFLAGISIFSLVRGLRPMRASL